MPEVTLAPDTVIPTDSSHTLSQLQAKNKAKKASKKGHQPKMGLSSKRSAQFAVGPLKFWALGDRLLIEEDQFRSGYECSECGGSGRLPCDNCNGTQTTTTGKKCSHCSDGSRTCPGCQGKGGLIVTPEISQRRPTSGTVVSAGSECKSLKVGDSVLYSNFAGYVVDLNRAGSPVTIRILHESEVLAGMEGHLTLTNLRGKSEIAAFTS
jgi:co-chaperonin GroES (HSP10)